MKVIIETIPHKRQRYPTVGDYYKDKKGVWHIKISNTGSAITNRLVMCHELIEFILVDWKGVSEKEITDFDVSFEKKRKKGNNDEPGFDPQAPYKNEHALATAVELMMCAFMGISWKEYEEKINSL
jgi:hypothetical protein